MNGLALHPLLLERWKRILPPDALLLATNSRSHADGQPLIPTAIRLNPLRAPPPETITVLRAAGIVLESVEWCDLAWTTGSTVRELQALPAYADGAFHIQSLSSIAVTLALAPLPGESILDLCAAPGSKTSHIAAMTGNSGHLVAVDSSRTRLFRLREVLRLLGATADCLCEHGERWARRQPEMFDRVLVDAPCSGEGRIHLGDSAAHDGWSMGKVRRLASLQKALLHSAIDALRPGGTLVYSTCTFAPEENELVIQRALDRFEGEIEIVPLPIEIPHARPALTAWENKELHPSIAHARRIFPPHEGFFIARIRKIPMGPRQGVMP